VEELGKDWVRVAAMVLVRTNQQCRSRWVESLDPNNTLGNKGKWTVEEDAKLTEVVEELGKDWVRVAAMVLVRTNQQCRSRWVESLDPNITLGKWTVEEDAKLTDAVNKHGDNKWGHSCCACSGSNEIPVSSKMAQTKRWTPDEDAKLIDTVKEHGVNNWAAVAALWFQVEEQKKQCRPRWGESLDPDTNTGEWTLDEEAKLTEAVKRHNQCRQRSCH
jgi:myb proto-oncogene protein